MSFNQFENIFLSKAIEGLGSQSANGNLGFFGLGGRRYMLFHGGDGWRYLGVCADSYSEKVPDAAFIPVKCYPPEEQMQDGTIDYFFRKFQSEVGKRADGVELHSI
jgi:hypothetical protein